MVIIVDGRRDSGVIVIPLSPLNAAIMISITKVGEELHEDLILGQGAIDDLGMETAVVDTLEVTSINPAVAVTIELQESLVSYRLPLGVQPALHAHTGMLTAFTYPDANKELIEVNGAIAISVEVSENCLQGGGQLLIERGMKKLTSDSA